MGFAPRGEARAQISGNVLSTSCTPERALAAGSGHPLDAGRSDFADGEDAQTGNEVNIEIHGIEDADLRARAVLTGDEAYALSEPLLSISVQASRAAR